MVRPVATQRTEVGDYFAGRSLSLDVVIHCWDTAAYDRMRAEYPGLLLRVAGVTYTDGDRNVSTVTDPKWSTL